MNLHCMYIFLQYLYGVILESGILDEFAWIIGTCIICGPNNNILSLKDETLEKPHLYVITAKLNTVPCEQQSSRKNEKPCCFDWSFLIWTESNWWHEDNTSYLLIFRKDMSLNYHSDELKNKVKIVKNISTLVCD